MSKTLAKIGKIAGIAATIAAVVFPPAAPWLALASTAATVGSQLTAKPAPHRGSLNNIIIAANAPIPYGVGRSYIGGNLVHDVGYGGTVDGIENPFRSMVFVYSGGGPIEEYEAFKADFTTITFDAGGGTSGEATGYYADHMFVRRQFGTCPESDALNIGTTDIPQWDTTSKLSGLAAAMFVLVWDEDGNKFASGVPQLGAVGKWAKCYDPRLDTTYPGGSGAHRIDDEDTWEWTANPALHFLTYAYGRHQNGVRVLGCGIPEDGMDLTAIVAWANVCDDNEWEANGAIYEGPDISRWDNLKSLAQAGGAAPVFSGGKLSVRVNAPVVSLDTITRDDLADADQRIAAMQPYASRKNGIVPRYRSESHRWEYVQSELVTDAAYVTEDGEPKTEEVQFNLVTDKDQAAQLAGYELVNRRELGPIVLTVKPRFMEYRIGEALTVDLPDEGLSEQLCVIAGRTVDPATLAIELTLVGETAAKHAFALGLTGTAPPTPTLTTPEDLDEAVGSNVDDAIVDAIAADDVLTRAEKSLVLIPEQSWLETQYAELLARAGSFGLSTTALTTAHDAWETYLEALDPAWDDTSASTPLVYDVGLTDALPGLSAPGSADWNTASAGNISDGTDVTEGGVDYRRLEDDDAGQSMSSRAPWTAGFTEGQALSIWMIVRKEGSTTAHSNLQLQADEATHAPTQAAVAEIQFNKATGAYNVGTGSGGVEDISGWFDGADELLVWATGTIPDSTPDNTDIRPSVAPARGSTAAWTALAASLGTLDLRGFMVATGTFDPETWLNAQGRDALRKRLADYREQLVLMQSTIDSIIAMSFLVTDDGGGGSTDIAEVSIPSSIDAFATTGFRDPGDGGGAMVRSIGTTAPAAGDYDPRLVPGESDTTVATEGGGTEGDGFYADASGTPRWFDIFIPTAPVNIMALGAKPFDSTLSGSDQLARRSLNTIAWRKAARMTAGGVAELLVPACDTPFEISFAAQLYNGHRVRIEGGLRNTRGDEIARYGAGADWSTTPYFSDSVLASGHHHTAHESYLWRGGNLITWSGFTPVYATNSIADTAGNIVRPVFGTLTGTSFEVEADDARVNPAYGKLFTSGILKADGKMSRVGPGLRAGGSATGTPLPIFPDAVADWPNESVNYDGHVSAGRIAVGQEVIVCVHDAYLQGVGNYDDDPYDPGYRYRGNGGTCFQWYIRERAIVTDVTGTTVTLDRELPQIEAWEATYGNGIFIIPGNRPDIMESRSVLSGIYPQLIRDVRVFGDGYLECIERPDGGRGTTFNIRSGAADYHIELAKNVSDYGLGGNFFHDSSQKFTDVIALRKMADIACGCARLNIEFGTMRAPWTGSSSTSTALVVNEMSRAVRVRGKSIITAANVQGLRFNACNGADVDIDTWRRAAGGSTLAPILCGNQVLGQAEDGNSEEDSDGVIDQSAPIRDNRVRIGESVTPEASYYVQMTAGEAMTVEGRYYGAVTKDAALLRGADNHLQCWFENGSIRMPQDATSDNVIDTNVPVEGLIGFSKETVASARVNGREVFPGKTEDITMSGVLTGTGNFSDGETVTIGDRTYTFQATLTDVDGNVDIGADLAASLANLADAINLGSGAGTDYAASTTANETVSATSDATTLTVTTLEPTVSDYVISTTTTATDATWGGNRLSGTTLETGGGAVDVTIDMTADKTSSVTAEKVLRLTGGNGINLAAIANATPGISKTLAIVNANTDASTESITFDSEVFNGGSLASVAAGLTTLVTVDVAATGALAMVSARENVNLIAPGSNMLPDPSFAEGGGGTAYDPFAVDEDDEVLRNDEEVSGSQVAYEWDLTGLVSTETRYEVGILRRAGALGAFALRLAGVEVWVGPDEYGNQPSQLAALIETPSVLPSPCLLELVVSEATYPLKFDFGTVVRPFSPNSQFDDAYVREASEATGGSGSTTTAASAVSFTPGGGVTATDVQAAIEELDDEKLDSADVGWEVVDSWTHSGDVANVDFTDLGDYQTLRIVWRGVTLSAAVARLVQVSINNGSSFYTTSGTDYNEISTAGVLTGVTGLAPHGGASTLARSGFVEIANNIAGAPKIGESNSTRVEISQSAVTSGVIDALRALATGANLTGGTITVLGRRRG